MLSAPRPRDTVLVVDDDDSSRDLLAQVLETGGFDVIAASTGERALLTLCQEGDEIDWLVSKVNLPRLVCGWLLADEYHTHHPDRAALLVSPALNTAKMLSAHAVFIPPATPMRVLEVLKALRTPEAARARTSSSSQAASPAIFHQSPGERGLQTDVGSHLSQCST
jgi:CheY-like chemotaxis protein